MASSIYDFLPPGTREQAGYAGLGALAQALIAGGAPTTTPGGGMAALGQGFGGFSNAYNSRMNSGLQQAMMGQQLQEAERKQEQQKAQQAAIGQFFTPPPVQMAMAGGPRSGPTPQAAQAAQPPIAQMFPGANVDALKSYATAFPEQFSKTVGERLTAKPEGYTLGPDQVRYDSSNRPIATGPAKPQTQTEYDKLVADAQGNDPYRKQIARDILARRGMPPTTTITNAVDLAAEKEENKGFGQSLIKEWDTIRDRANTSQDAINQLSIARTIKAPAGALEPAKAKVGAVAQALGVSPQTLSMFGLDRATDAQAFTGVMQNLVLTKMQAQKGPQTENDAKRIESTLANIGNTEQAQDFLMRTSVSLARRDVEQRSFFEDWHEKNGTFKGAAKAWREHIGNTPLVGTSPNTRLPVFFDEFAEANRGKSRDAILEAWRKQYGG